GRWPTRSSDSATNGTEIASDAQNRRCLEETSGLQSAMIAITLASPTYAAAPVPIGTVNRFDWTYRSARPIGGDPSTTRMRSPLLARKGPTKAMAVALSAG